MLCLAEELDGGQYLFAFRMLMVLFRREFSFVDTLYLWEVRNNYQDLHVLHNYLAGMLPMLLT